MPIEILMPTLSPTMTEGNLARWIKKEGDKVKSGDVIAEIETDKATMEVEAVDDGTLAKIMYPAGTQGIKVGALIALLLEEGESLPAGTPSSAPPPAPVKAEILTPQPKTAPQPIKEKEVPASGGGRVLASPLARRIAQEAGVALDTLSGTGPHGRIIRADVETAIVGGVTTPVPASPAAPVVQVKTVLPQTSASYEAIPNNGMRRTIARRLTEAKQTIPHFYLSVDCELDALLDLRKKMNEATGSKISVNDFVIRAVALALQKVPAANATWTEEAILRYGQSDVSVAVSTPGGLITPIVKAAESKSLSSISMEMKELAARARDGKLKPDEYQGGGFTVSNLGMYGIRQFSAIINPPQACILAVGAGEQRAVVKDGALAVATVMTCTLSTDHRAVDGAVGAEFMAAFKALIENPYGLVA